MQWLNCADQKQFTTIVEYNAGARERLDFNHYEDLVF